MKSIKAIVPGGVEEYINRHPQEVQKQLREIRAIIKQAAPGSIETMSYFQMPGYSYEGFEYNGMFAWFSTKNNYLRLHVIPPVIDDYAEELKSYLVTKSIVSFQVDKELPVELITRLVKSSITKMKKSSIV